MLTYISVAGDGNAAGEANEYRLLQPKVDKKQAVLGAEIGSTGGVAEATLRMRTMKVTPQCAAYWQPKLLEN
jgi:hypothetical protein